MTYKEALKCIADGENDPFESIKDETERYRRWVREDQNTALDALKEGEDLLRWRKVGEEMPLNRGYCIVMCQGSAALYLLLPGVSPSFAEMGVTHWRPIGPLPEGGE